MKHLNVILASTSTLYGGKYLEYLKPQLEELFENISEVLFIPYARPGGISFDEYTSKASQFFSTINIQIKGIHEYYDPQKAIQNAEAYFTGGGNTFLLIKTLYENGLIQNLKDEILSGKPYLGTSAGSNIAGMTIKTTNDMPIVYPPSFDGMGLVPFNINPHYLDPDPTLEHNGETRETRILEFLSQNDTKVVGLREGNWIRMIEDQRFVDGPHTTRIFEKDKKPYEIEPKTEI